VARGQRCYLLPTFGGSGFGVSVRSSAILWRPCLLSLSSKLLLASDGFRLSSSFLALPPLAGCFTGWQCSVVYFVFFLFSGVVGLLRLSSQNCFAVTLGLTV